MFENKWTTTQIDEMDADLLLNLLDEEEEEVYLSDVW